MYLHALMLRVIDVDKTELPRPSGIEPLLSEADEDSSSETSIPIWIRDNSPNESTFGLTLPFLVMEWLYTVPSIKLAVNAQWNTVHLPSPDQRVLSLPKPDPI